MKYFRIKRDDHQIIDNTKLLTMQNGNRSFIDPDLFYYCIERLKYLLINWSILLGKVNRARATIYKIIFYAKGNYKLF